MAVSPLDTYAAAVRELGKRIASLERAIGRTGGGSQDEINQLRDDVDLLQSTVGGLTSDISSLQSAVGDLEGHFAWPDVLPTPITGFTLYPGFANIVSRQGNIVTVNFLLRNDTGSAFAISSSGTQVATLPVNYRPAARTSGSGINSAHPGLGVRVDVQPDGVVLGYVTPSGSIASGGYVGLSHSFSVAANPT